jgi:hypothetical protein
LDGIWSDKIEYLVNYMQIDAVLTFPSYMLLRLQLFLFLICAASASCLAQISDSDVTQLRNVAQYTGSQDELIKTLATSIRYPALAQRANIIGTAVNVIKISRSGEIVEVGTLNKAIPELKQEFERIAPSLKGKWAATNDTAQFFYAVIPVQFSIVGQGYKLNSDLKPDFFQVTVVITASGVSRDKIEAAEKSGAEVYQRRENALVTQVNEYVQADNYAGAISVLEELVNLQPLHTAYYQPLIALHERIGNEQEAAYYTEVMQLFTK